MLRVAVLIIVVRCSPPLFETTAERRWRRLVLLPVSATHVQRKEQRSHYKHTIFRVVVAGVVSGSACACGGGRPGWWQPTIRGRTVGWQRGPVWLGVGSHIAMCVRPAPVVDGTISHRPNPTNCPQWREHGSTTMREHTTLLTYLLAPFHDWDLFPQLS